MNHYWRYTKHLEFRLGWFGRIVVHIEERHTATGERRWRRARWKDKAILERQHQSWIAVGRLDKRSGHR